MCEILKDLEGDPQIANLKSLNGVKIEELGEFIEEGNFVFTMSMDATQEQGGLTRGKEGDACNISPLHPIIVKICGVTKISLSFHFFLQVNPLKYVFQNIPNMNKGECLIALGVLSCTS